MRLTSATAIAKKRERKQKKSRRRAELGTERNNVSAAGWKGGEDAGEWDGVRGATERTDG
jgi:hypothetical protein